MAITMPKGKRFAVCFTFDVDVTSLWLGCFKFHTMNPLSRGEFGIRYGLGRILDLLDKYDIKATFYRPAIPRFTMGVRCGRSPIADTTSDLWNVPPAQGSWSPRQ